MTTGMPDICARALAALAAARGEARIDPDASFAALAPVVARIPASVRAVTLAARFADRAMRAHGAFWFPQRETLLGCIGFPHALVAIDPHALAETTDLAQLDAREADLARALKDVPREGRALSVDDYARAFDPAFVQVLLLDEARVRSALAMPPAQAAGLLRDALRTSVEPMTADTLVDAWCAPLGQGEVRARERFVRLFGEVAGTAPAEEGFWADVVARLSARGDGAPRVLGLFAQDSARAVVESPHPRLYRVQLAVPLADGRPRDADGLVVRALELRAQLAKLARDANASQALAMRRATANELGDEGAAQKVGAALRRS